MSSFLYGVAMVTLLSLPSLPQSPGSRVPLNQLSRRPKGPCYHWEDAPHPLGPQSIEGVSDSG